MATGKHRIARAKEVFIFPDKRVEFNSGDNIPPVIELYGAAESLEGGPVFEGTDVPVEYVHYYLDNDHSLHVFIHDYPSVGREQAMAKVEERRRQKVDSIINIDSAYVSGQPRFNGTRMNVYTLFDHLRDGNDIDGFSSAFDTGGYTGTIG